MKVFQLALNMNTLNNESLFDLFVFVVVVLSGVLAGNLHLFVIMTNYNPLAYI